MIFTTSCCIPKQEVALAVTPTLRWEKKLWWHRFREQADLSMDSCQSVDGQPLTLQPFNSCAFPTWPLQILIQGLYNCADFWKKATGKCRPNWIPWRGQVQLVSCGGGWSWARLLADGQPMQQPWSMDYNKRHGFPCSSLVCASSAAGYRCSMMPPSPDAIAAFKSALNLSGLVGAVLWR